MASPQSRSSEADAVEEVYHWALTRVGVGVLADAMATWAETMPVTGGVASYSDSVWKLVSIRRSWLLRLAVAHYRLVRALRTGATIPEPTDLPEPPQRGAKPTGEGLKVVQPETSSEPRTERSEGGTETIESLRQDFEAIVEEIALHAGGSPKDVGVVPHLPEVDPEDDEPVPVEELERDIDDIFAELERNAEDRLKASIDAVGPSMLDKMLAEIDAEDSASVVDAKRAEVHAKRGRAQAAAAERITMQAARGLTYDLAEADMRVLGWIRYSKTGTPCGWCAMLLSRGFTKKSGLYRSEASATNGPGVTTSPSGEVAQAFHDNCHCVAVPIFLKEQLSSPLFALNQKYAELWPQVTQGHGAKDAIAVWRRYIRSQSVEQQSTDAAQAAA